MRLESINQHADGWSVSAYGREPDTRWSGFAHYGPSVLCWAIDVTLKTQTRLDKHASISFGRNHGGDQDCLAYR